MWMVAAIRGKDGKGHRGLGTEAQKSKVQNPLQEGEVSVGGRGLNPSSSLWDFVRLQQYHFNKVFKVDGTL